MGFLIIRGMEMLMKKTKSSQPGKELSVLMITVLVFVLMTGCGNAAGGSGEKSDLSGEAESAQISEAGSFANTAEEEKTALKAEEEKVEESAEPAADLNTDGTAGKAVQTSAAAETQKTEEVRTEEGEPVIYGDERADIYLPLLEGKRVAVFSNQSGIVGNKILGSASEDDGTPESADAVAEDAAAVSAGEKAEDTAGEAEAEDLIPFGQDADGAPVEYGEHILDALVRQGADVTVAFSPEHGFRGTEDAGAAVYSYVDEKTGVPVVSLYGGGSMYPSDADLDRFDTLVIDIQDVGLRFYTYYISMYYLMDACAQADKEVVILDRPNPNGFYVDGPILQDGFYSGVGMLPIPVVHGMTLGELAQMINGEGWLPAGKDACSLTVVPCDNYRHYTMTTLVIRPSPNLKDMRAVYLYPSTCLFENTACSVGRGTAHPFEIFGSPWLEGAGEYDFTFTPQDMEGAHSPAFQGQTCYGKDLRKIPLVQILEEHFNLDYVVDAYKALQAQNPGISFFGNPDGDGHYWIDYLCGTDRIRLMIEEGRSAEEISASWQEDVEDFKAQRRPYLLYEE